MTNTVYNCQQTTLIEFGITVATIREVLQFLLGVRNQALGIS